MNASNSQIDFPYHFDSRRRTAMTDEADHIRDLIEQVLFTVPGERVNRPTFGCGLIKQVFAPNNDLLASSLQQSIQASLLLWLGDLISVEAVVVESEEETLRVTVSYTILQNRQRQAAQFFYQVSS